MPVIHFASKEDERRSNAYRHIHGIPAPKRTTADVAGHSHKIKHSSLSKGKGKKAKKHGGK
jgi:hypothetical protein